MRGRLLALVLLAGPALAAERPFAYTQTSALLEPGQREAQVDGADRLLRSDDYNEVDTRFGFAFGLSKWLEAQLLLDLDIATPATGEADALGFVTGLLRARLLDGRSAPLGLAVNVAASVGPDHGRLEARAVADRSFGRLLLAFNALASGSFGTDATPTRFEESLGLVYQLPTRVGLGLEVRNRHALDPHAHFTGDALYLGPTLSLRRKRVWAATSLLMQVGALKAKAQQGNGEPNEVLDNERFNLRLVLGFDLD